jgi:glycerol-3-phosphate dehydrogenase
MLLGPNAVETPCREDTASYRPEVEAIMEVQKKVALDLDDSQIIAYFTGVRAPSYEEDFVVRKGLFTDNIIEAAAIQSPGLTAAPAIAQDVAAWAVDYLSAGEEVQENPDFHARRKAPPRLASLPDEERAALIRDNPDYGLIICRCEEISKGEILDALRSPLQVPTMDAIKRRLRPGMGRCQGSFCGPLLADIIARERGMRLDQVRKEGPLSVITYGETKEARP